MKFSLALLATAAMAEESPEQARLVVSKKTETKILAQNQDLTFSYKIYNIGKDAAVDVSLPIFLIFFLILFFLGQND